MLEHLWAVSCTPCLCESLVPYCSTLAMSAPMIKERYFGTRLDGNLTANSTKCLPSDGSWHSFRQRARLEFGCNDTVRQLHRPKPSDQYSGSHHKSVRSHYHGRAHGPGPGYSFHIGNLSQLKFRSESPSLSPCLGLLPSFLLELLLSFLHFHLIRAQ
jgi:hypothetical protein